MAIQTDETTELRAVRLRVEHRDAPLGVGARQPRLSWELSGGRAGGLQSAWRVRIQRNDSGRATVWDSGRIAGKEQLVQLPELVELQPRTAYGWQVLVWDQDGREGSWSKPAVFETGFLSHRDWSAHWLALHKLFFKSAAHVRREFDVDPAKPIAQARAYVAATGGAFGNLTMRMNLYHLRLNGRKVGADILSPGQLSARRGRALVRAFDVTDMLRPGSNAVGLIFLADKISAQIVVEYADGSQLVIGTDSSWRKNHAGPFVQLWEPGVDEHGGKGEMYDARREFGGWDQPGYDDSTWLWTSVCSPAEILAAQLQAVVVTETLPARRITRDTQGVLVDFGQNTHGFVEIKLRGQPGAPITIRYAEKLHPDGALDFASVRNKFHGETDAPRDTYIPADNAPHWYAPTFALHGFRYVHVTGLAGELTAADIVAKIAHSDVLSGSQWTCSHERLDRLQRLGYATMRANLLSVPTDCPHRERNGWLGDALDVAEAECLNFDMAAFYDKWFDDIADTQEATGFIPSICPFADTQDGIDLPWAAAVVCVAWDAYQAHGDLAALQTRYPLIARWLEFCATLKDNTGMIHNGVRWGDHVALDRSSKEFMGLAWYFRGLTLAAEIATVLRRNADAARWRQEADTTRALINRQFLNTSRGYDTGSQSAQAHALHFGLVPADRRAAIVELLAADVRARNLTTGCHGTYCAIPALADNGHNDLVYRLATGDGLGTWGYWLDQHGATTALETWPGIKDVSHNHPFLIGSVCAWFYRHLAGIRCAAPGYAAVRIQPYCPDGLAAVDAALVTVRGTIRSRWQREANGTIRRAVEIPNGIHLLT